MYHLRVAVDTLSALKGRGKMGLPAAYNQPVRSF